MNKNIFLFLGFFTSLSIAVASNNNKTMHSLDPLLTKQPSNTIQAEHDKSVLAENFDRSVVLTQEQFSQWLEHNNKYRYYDKKTQIEAYFVQKYLISQKHQLPKEILGKIDFYHEIEKYELARGLYQKKITKNLKFSESELNEEIERLHYKNKQKSHKVRLYQIYKRYPVNATKKQKMVIKNKMQKIREDIHNLNDFKKLAISESNAQSRLQKGLIGNVPKGMLDPSIDKIVMQMQQGELSQIIELPSGQVLFYCEKIIPVKTISEQKLKEMAFKNLKGLKLDKLKKEKKQQILSKNNFIIDWKIIRESNQKGTSIAVQSLTLGNLDRRQLLWLLAPYNTENSDFSSESDEKISHAIENYFVNKNIYNEHFFGQKSAASFGEIKQLQTNRIVSEMMAFKIKPQLTEATDDEIVKFYHDNATEFLEPIKYNFTVLGKELSDKSRKKTYQELAVIYQNLKNNKITFEEAIEKHSVIDDKFPNINLHRIAKKRLSKIFGVRISNDMIGMKIGEISDIIETKSGYLWLVRLNEISPKQQMSLAMVKDHIMTQIMNERILSLQYQAMDDILDEQKIKIF